MVYVQHLQSQCGNGKCTLGLFLWAVVCTHLAPACSLLIMTTRYSLILALLIMNCNLRQFKYFFQIVNISRKLGSMEITIMNTYVSII